MPHAKQQIREALVTLLTGLTTTGSRVYKSRVYPSGDDAIPGLNILTGNCPQDEEFGTLGGLEKWDLENIIEARAKPGDGTDVDDQLDTIEAEVTAAIRGDPTLGNRVMFCKLLPFEPELTDELERPAGIKRMVWQTPFLILGTDPTNLIFHGS